MIEKVQFIPDRIDVLQISVFTDRDNRENIEVGKIIVTSIGGTEYIKFRRNIVFEQMFRCCFGISAFKQIVGMMEKIEKYNKELELRLTGMQR